MGRRTPIHEIMAEHMCKALESGDLVRCFSGLCIKVERAKKDRTAYLARLKTGFEPSRKDLHRYYGAWMVISHNGVGEDGFDIGWGCPLLGIGGFPDDWIDIVIQLPWNTLEHYERTSNWEEKTDG